MSVKTEQQQGFQYFHEMVSCHFNRYNLCFTVASVSDRGIIVAYFTAPILSAIRQLQ